MKIILIFTVVVLWGASGNAAESPRQTEHEYKKIITDLHYDTLHKLAYLPLVIEALKESNKHCRNIVDIMKLDASWQANRKLQQKILQNPIAKQVEQMTNSTNNRIVEVLIMDKSGTLVGAFPKTTDYWQGDEAKFQQPIVLRGEFVGPTKWDPSTQTYSFIFSFLIRENSEIIGVLAAGLDVSREYLDNTVPAHEYN
ncbi:PDC sensor domain-containing protein [Thalassomonas actiniarum]|uniref:Cache domain-containing protein n=1 Tax=Thalassomonas actiniarum TaxID=485447 RepID=A0AAE9YR64_9GAMM|nr:PDC sensor domain-containing protein [Thalassomonas actiniarum]WDD98789.1 hypothetical protein SG35_026770 [Thalassomonas actiniarum]